MQVRPASTKTLVVTVVAFAAIFVAIFVFFSSMYPMYIFDTDDWVYVGYQRMAIPFWGGWNPTRVLAEVLMPLCGSISAFVVQPFVHDYVESLMLVDAAAVAGFVTLYAGSFYVLVRKRFETGRNAAYLWTVFFVLVHFLVFRNSHQRSDYLLYSVSVTTYFYYTIPALLSGSLLMLHVAGCWDVLHEQGKWGRKALLVLGIYLALFSNVHGEVILAAYLGMVLVFGLVKWLRGGRVGGIAAFARAHAPELVFVLGWFVVQLFEMNGGRAAYLNENVSFASLFVETVAYLASDFGRLWLPLVALGVVVSVAGLVVALRGGGLEARKTLGVVLRLAAAFPLLVLYLLLLCAKSIPYTMSRSDAAFGVFFYLILVCFLLGGELSRACPPLGFAAPIAVFVGISAMGFTAQSFLIPNRTGGPAQLAKVISDDIVEQVVSAEAAGLNHVDVLVPKYDSFDNWPLGSYGGSYVADTLVRHRVIGRTMDVTLVPSEEKSAEFGVGVAQNGTVEIADTHGQVAQAPQHSEN